MTRRMYDWSTVPVDPHLDVSAFYIGGDTPHLATDAEIASQSARWRLPIYTCDNPASRDPRSDAAQAVAWLRAHQVPAGSAVGLDYETAVDGFYVSQFDAAIKAAGWTLLLYGSLSRVTQNPRPSAGYWTASWTGVPHLDSGASATQYASDTMLKTGYDLSEVSDSLVLWDTEATVDPPTSTGDDEPVHIDLSSGTPQEFTPPCAIRGGTSVLALGCDFGSATVRVARYSFAAKGWTVTDYPLEATGGTAAIELTQDDNKVSLELEAGFTATAVGATVI